MQQIIQNHWFITLLIIAIAAYYIRKAIIVPSKVEEWDREDNFKETVNNMTGAQLVQAMIDSIRYKWVNIDMSSFGKVKYAGCGADPDLYGCAATQLECEIAGKAFTAANIGEVDTRTEFLGITRNTCGGTRTDDAWLKSFEQAINHLRQGNINSYNEYAENLTELPSLKSSPYTLPQISGKRISWRTLRSWQKYANWLEEQDI